jgi:DUF4097 and DUF4098 domain-containing protein YvlB
MRRPLRHLPLCALLLTPCWSAAVRADVVERSFDVRPGGTLRLDTDRGSIEITTVEAPRVTVRVERESRSGSIDVEDHRVELEQNEADVVVRGDTERGLFGWRSSRLHVRYLVTVPSRYDLDLETAGGDITVSDLEGEVRARTSGGDLVLGRVDGPVTASTSGGDVELTASSVSATVRSSGGDLRIGDVQGRVDAHTSGGNVWIEHAAGDVVASTSGGDISVAQVRGAIEARTSGGDIVATIAVQPIADCSLSTSGGRVEVRLAADLAADIDAHASGGRLQLDLPLTVRGAISRSRVEGTLNGGGPRLTLRSSGGDILLRRL